MDTSDTYVVDLGFGTVRSVHDPVGASGAEHVVRQVMARRREVCH